MSIIFKTNDPDKLLAAFKDAIDKSKIETWSYDQDGDFTHSVEQWKNKAWFHVKKTNNDLIFSILKPVNTNITSVVYAVYHGRFIESMLTHCDTLFISAIASSMPSDGDIISS